MQIIVKIEAHLNQIPEILISTWKKGNLAVKVKAEATLPVGYKIGNLNTHNPNLSSHKQSNWLKTATITATNDENLLPATKPIVCRPPVVIATATATRTARMT